MLFVGVDGGGTKTAFCLSDEQGSVLASCQLPTLDYMQIGFDGIRTRLTEGVHMLLNQVNGTIADIAGVCIGAPNYGEVLEDTKKLDALPKDVFESHTKVCVINDVHAACLGAHALKSGICIVAGTGAMGVGIDETRAVDRSGGWGCFIGDEGSCYWMGKEAMSLFSRQADGREKRDKLYDIVMEKYQLKDPFEFIDIAHNQIADKRDEIAWFQMLLNDAALLGDAGAIGIYRQAAVHLGALPRAIQDKLNFKNKPVKVSYAGSAFKIGKLLFEPLEEILHAQDQVLIQPEKSPVEGAVLQAIAICRESQ